MAFKNNDIPWNKGKKMSKEYGRMRGNAHKGQKHSEETKRKISKSMKGKKFTDEHKKKLSESHKGEEKKPFTKEHKRKLSEAKKGNKNRLGVCIKHKKETIIKMRESRIKYMTSGKLIYKNTSIEKKIENELKNANLNYQKQVALCKIGIVDFFLSYYNIIVECYGDYCHNLLKHKQKDATKNLIYSLNGYKIFIFWEHEINKAPKSCIKKILKYIKRIKIL